MLKRYLQIPKPVLWALLAEFFIQLINASFLLIFNIYMHGLGYADFKVADFLAWRYLAVLVTALPLGIYLKGKKLKPLFYWAGFLVPLSSLAMLLAARQHADNWIYALQMLWGLGYTLQQVAILPYILRNSPSRFHSEGFALKFAAWSLATIVTGAIIYFFSYLNKDLFSDYSLLVAISICGFASLLCIKLIGKHDNLSEVGNSEVKVSLKNYDWRRIAWAQLPPTLISLGAGLTIPFINLFFLNVHGMGSAGFSIMGALSAVLVSIGFFQIPYYRKKYGYTVAVNYFQYVAVVALFVLASTDWYSGLNIALPLAVGAFLVRQPFMNMAAPMASELVMVYTGARNREMTSALTSAINSGSWFVSALLFKYLRQEGVSYGVLFTATAILYAVATVLFQVLINDMNRVVKKSKASREW